MKNIVFKKIIIYLSFALLFLTGSFLWFGKTAKASDITVKTDDGNTMIFSLPEKPGSVYTSEDGKTVIYTVKPGENSEDNVDVLEPGKCRICKENDCLAGQPYCMDCYVKLINGINTADFYLKYQDAKKEEKDKQAAQAEIDKQVEEWAKENNKKPSKEQWIFVPIVLGIGVVFVGGVLRFYFHSNNLSSSTDPVVFQSYKESDYTTDKADNANLNQSVVKEAPQEELKEINLNKAAKEVIITENKNESETEKVLVKKNFEDCLKQQTTSFHSGDSFAVCIGENDELILMHYYSNSFNTVKVKVEDNGKLKVVHDFRRDHDFMVAIDYELGKDSLKFNLKSAKGNAVSFVLKPIVNTKINGYTINYDQTRDYMLITITCLPNFINWIQQNAVLEEQKKKELTNQELREKVKNLDPEVRNKFMELAKNGKTNEAIKVCNEVTELGLKDAKRVIEYKLYY